MGRDPSMVRRRILQIAAFCAAVLCQPQSAPAQNFSEGKAFSRAAHPHHYEKEEVTCTGRR
jgi:hypothetical protein